MDYHKILNILTTKTDDSKDFDEKLVRILINVSKLIPENLKQELDTEIQESEDQSPRRQYLETILCVLKALNTEVLLKSKTYMSVSEYRGVKVAIEMSISLGIIPCLLPGIGLGLSKLSRNASKLTPESLTDPQKYERLVLTTRTLTSCYEEISLRPAILAHLGPIVGALFQLAFAPLVKPSKDNSSPMTPELYSQFSKDQEEFKVILKNLIDNCPTSLMMKELMVLSGLEKAPNWLKRTTRVFLIDSIVLPNGVMSLINATCEDFDLGLHWQKLETISMLITNSSKDSKYFDSISKQFLRILASKNIKHSTAIANCLISTLYEVHPDICVEKIIKVLTATLSLTQQDLQTKSKDLQVIKTESQVEECVENLVKCFVSQSKGKFLPVELIKNISLPLFYLHVEIHSSAVHLKSKVRELLVQLLKSETLTQDLFGAFLQGNEEYGARLFFKFGSNGGVEVVSKLNEKVKLKDEADKLADSLLDLVKPDQDLSTSLLNYLLKWLSNQTSKNKNFLGNEQDLADDLCKQLVAQKLLINLSSIQGVQRGLIKAPLPLLNFVKALFEDSNNYESIYASLMLVKVILDEKPKDWSPFEELVDFLQKKREEFPGSGLDELIGEVSKVVRLKGKTPRYQDLNVDKLEENFDKALQDLADPLLPVRAHGLMTLTKLIDNSDPRAIDRKDLVLCLFRENLKDEDSFVYLTAINGLCAMASKFPKEVIEILVQEFIDMPGHEVPAENRAKLGEILVKTTKALGDMAPAYKNLLINGFLCGVRDRDGMVRASSLSCLGELCKVLGFKLGNAITEVLYCVGKIIETDKEQECRRAGVLVINLLIRGLGKDVLTDLGSELLPVYRALKFLRDNDNDEVLRLHAQLALEELDDIVREFLFAKPVMQKNIYLIS